MADLVGQHRTTRAAGVGPAVDIGLEEEAVDDQLTPAVEQVEQAGRTAGPVEQVVLLDRHPRHPPALCGQRITGAGELLLLHQQFLAGGCPTPAV